MRSSGILLQSGFRKILLLCLCFCLLLAGALVALWKAASGTAEAKPATPDAIAAFRSSAPWVIRRIDSTGSVGQYASLGLDRTTGGLYIGYYDATNTNLKMATNAASGVLGAACSPASDWVCRVLSSADHNAGTHVSVDTFPGGYGWAYRDTTLNQLIATWNTGGILNGGYFDNTGATTVGQYNSLAFNQQNHPVVAYQNIFSGGSPKSALQYAWWVGSGGDCSPAWKCFRVNPDFTTYNTGNYTSLGLNSNDYPRIAYQGHRGQLEIAEYTGLDSSIGCGSKYWECYVLDNSFYSGNNMSLYVKRCLSCSSPSMAVAYFDYGTNQLRYARYVGSGGTGCSTSAWQCDNIGHVGDIPAYQMAVSLEAYGGSPVIAYRAVGPHGNSILKIAYPTTGIGNCGPAPDLFQTWVCEVVDNGNRGLLYNQVGWHASLEISGNGLASIAYHNSSSMELLLAQQMLPVYLPTVRR